MPGRYRILGPRVRGALQVVVIVALALVAWRVTTLSSQASDDEATVTAVSGILARTCGAASFAELRQQGLVEECHLAQQGELSNAIPDDKLPSAGTAPDDVNPDVVPDKDTSPADVTPAPLSPRAVDGVVASAVGRWFDAHPLGAQPSYQAAIQRATSVYLTQHPPRPGKTPTPAQVQDAVRTVLLANPPADGKNGATGAAGANGTDGAAGRSVASASKDGCDVVFTYSDGTSDRIGPLCGADGKDGADATDTQVASAVKSYCEANGSCQGPQGVPGVVRADDSCQPADGEFVTDVSITFDPGSSALVLTCATGSVLPGLGNAG